MKKIFLFFIIIGIGLTIYFFSEAFKNKNDEMIRISSNPWVGFTPLAYAQEKGWLDKTPFRIVWVVDLSDNSRLYEKGFTQGFTATQFELLHFKNPSDFTTAFLVDRSNGADAILSNYSLEELRKTDQDVKVFLEQGSLHEDMFQAFVTENKLQNIKFEPVNIAQDKLAKIKTGAEPVILMTYEPYLAGLMANGWKQISSTRDLRTFFVIDGVFVKHEVLKGNEAKFAELKAIVQKALERYHANPKEFYETIKGYLNGQSYEEFVESEKKIDWITVHNSEIMIQELHEQNIDTEAMVQ